MELLPAKVCRASRELDKAPAWERWKASCSLCTATCQAQTCLGTAWWASWPARKRCWRGSAPPPRLAPGAWRPAPCGQPCSSCATCHHNPNAGFSAEPSEERAVPCQEATTLRWRPRSRSAGCHVAPLRLLEKITETTHQQALETIRTLNCKHFSTGRPRSLHPLQGPLSHDGTQTELISFAAACEHRC